MMIMRMMMYHDENDDDKNDDDDNDIAYLYLKEHWNGSNDNASILKA